MINRKTVNTKTLNGRAEKSASASVAVTPLRDAANPQPPVPANTQTLNTKLEQVYLRAIVEDAGDLKVNLASTPPLFIRIARGVDVKLRDLLSINTSFLRPPLPLFIRIARGWTRNLVTSIKPGLQRSSEAITVMGECSEP